MVINTIVESIYSLKGFPIYRWMTITNIMCQGLNTLSWWRSSTRNILEMTSSLVPVSFTRMAIGVAGHRQPNRMEIGRRSRGRVEGNPTKFKSAFWAKVATKHSTDSFSNSKIDNSFYGDFGGVPNNQLKGLKSTFPLLHSKKNQRNNSLVPLQNYCTKYLRAPTILDFLRSTVSTKLPTQDEKLPASWKGFWSSIRASRKWLLRCQAKKILTICVCLRHHMFIFIFTYSWNWKMSAILRKTWKKWYPSIKWRNSIEKLPIAFTSHRSTQRLFIWSLGVPRQPANEILEMVPLTWCLDVLIGLVILEEV